MNPRRLSTESQEKDPGAYPIPFSVFDAELGSRLDSIRPSLRYWAVNPERVGACWHKDILEANNRYEQWLSTQPPGEYPVPFKPAEGKRLDEIEDDLRYWGVHRDRSSSPWYNFFKSANDRYEQYLAATREPGDFPFPRGNNTDYKGVPIKDIPQDIVWWALRPSNRHQGWYEPMYNANKRMLDDVYKSRSPGSEPLWFGRRYRGLRLDQVYERKGFMRWCFSRMEESGQLYRLRDLVERLEEWRRVHPERSSTRQRRKAPDIQNPVGEAIGPWDDSLGSAGEDDYDKDSFIQSDSEELEYATENEGKLMDDDSEDNEDSEDSQWPISLSTKVRPSVTYLHKRRRRNAVLSDDSEESEESGRSVGKLGKRYRVQYESSEE